MTTVAIMEDIHNAFLDYEPIQKLRERAHVVAFTRALAPGADRQAAMKGVEIAVGLRERTRFDGDFLRDAPDLQLIVQTGRVGPNLDMDAITRAGVLVATAAGGGANSTIELTIGLIISIMRRIPQGDAGLRRGEWVLLPYGRAMFGKTLGVIGPGRIGAEVAKLGVAFGMKVQTWSRNITPERAAALGATATTLDELMRTSDVVTVHLPLNEGTRNLISADKLDMMKPEAYFINTSRGPIADEGHLVQMLQERRIAGAALDVYNTEPLPANHPLLALDNVVLTPHIGWPADTGYAAFTQSVARVINDYLDGHPSNIANPEARK